MCSIRKGVLRNFAKFTGKHLCQSLFFNKVAGLACSFMKQETLTQVFSCDFCQISKNTFFTEHLWATASCSRPELICLLNSCSENYLRTPTKTSIVGNIFVKLETISFTKYGLRHVRFSSSNFAELVRKAIFHNTSWSLLIPRPLIKLI